MTPFSVLTRRLKVPRPAGLSTAALLALAAGCAVGPDYKAPPATARTPPAFKEAAGWTKAVPSDQAPRGSWWTSFDDPDLTALETEVDASNESLKEAEANYEESRQVARADNATFWPALTLGGAATRTKEPASRNSLQASSAPGNVVNLYTAEAGVSWQPDFWGKIRRQTEEDVSAAQASAADVVNARLSSEGTLGEDYVGLRILDEKKRLLDHAVSDYEKTLQITVNKYKVGVAARSDVISAQAQVDATRASAIDVGVQRAQYEHAIAILIGKVPADFSIPVRATVGVSMPGIPLGMPSELLERRPDIAAAERAVAEANAKIGVQTAAYYPDLTLSADGEYEGSELGSLFSTPNRVWSLGANLSDTLFDWGERHDEVLEAKAAYDSSVANYRQTVLSAFQQVEDNLAGLRVLEQEAQVQETAVTEAADAARIALNEYNAGTEDYTTVVTAQVTELTDRENLLTIQQERLTDSVVLIEALGGGWSTSDLPTHGDVLARHPNRQP